MHAPYNMSAYFVQLLLSACSLCVRVFHSALTVPDPRGAVVSVCYEDIGDLDAPEEGGGQTDPTR